MDQYVVQSIEERLHAWRKAEDAAVQAQAAITQLGQAAADPRTRDLFIKAGKLRTEADQMFSAIVRAVDMTDRSPG